MQEIHSTGRNGASTPEAIVRWPQGKDSSEIEFLPRSDSPPIDQAALFLASTRDPERFRYPVEIELGTESERSPEIEFLIFIKWRCCDGRR
jgi:hypothetical protein